MAKLNLKAVPSPCRAAAVPQTESKMADGTDTLVSAGLAIQGNRFPLVRDSLHFSSPATTPANQSPANIEGPRQYLLTLKTHRQRRASIK